MPEYFTKEAISLYRKNVKKEPYQSLTSLLNKLHSLCTPSSHLNASNASEAIVSQAQ